MKKEGGAEAENAGAEFSLAAHDEDHGEAGCSPAVHGGPRWSRYPPVACGGPHAGAGGCLKEAVTPWRAHARTGLLAGLVTQRGTHTGAACS